MGSIGTLLAEGSGLVVALDTTSSCGRPMVAHLLSKWRRHSRTHTAVCVLAFDSPPGGWLAPAAGDAGQRRGFVEEAGGIEKEVWVDCYTDPLGWDGDVTAANRQPTGSTWYSIAGRDADGLITTVRQAKKDVGESEAWLVVVDSLSTMLLRFGAARAFHVLGELRAIFGIDCQPADRSSSSTGASSTMLALAHEDVHDARTVGCLEQMASTVLRFLPLLSGATHRECEILNKRPSGRITLETQTFTVDEAGEVTLTKQKAKKASAPVGGEPATALALGEAQPSSKVPAVKAPIDPAAGLTFSLTRTAQQEQDRQALVLPHDQRAAGAVELPNLDDFADDDDDEDEDDDPDGDLDI